ncbi:MAG: TatD family hydrolase, partial [Proteobacteria bacterium]|nr:TatD family hydrolase [Pseudomonadota bacterium]
MPHSLIDIGANLTHASFADDFDDVLSRAAAVGITRMVVTGSSDQGNIDAADLADAWPGRLFATAGVHPHHAADYTDAS